MRASERKRHIWKIQCLRLTISCMVNATDALIYLFHLRFFFHKENPPVLSHKITAKHGFCGFSRTFLNIALSPIWEPQCALLHQIHS